MNEADTKRCTRCGIEKPLAAFHRKPGGRHGRHAHCRDCFNAGVRERTSARKAGNQLPRRLHGPIEPLPEAKVCSKCGVEKPIDAYGKQKGGRFGRHPTCKECRRASTRRHYEENRDGILAKQKLNPQKHENQRWAERKAKYGVTREIYAAMVAAQDGRCAVCGERPDRLCIDHDHETGKVRGLLCSSCNIALGHFRDDPVRLAAAIGYLRSPPAVLR